ncbi:PD-(D/E)XK nuclease family protein, partial [Staphylococcus aureus]
MRKAVNSFLKWWAMQDIKVIKAEQKLCSPKMKLAGTADLVCELNGKLTILDWKTGSGIYPEAVLQMGAYAE